MTEPLNPYAPPTTPLANPGQAGVSAGRRSPWAVLRWLPIAYCGFLTLGCLALGGFQVYLLSLLLGGRPLRVPDRREDLWVVALAFPVAFTLAGLGIRSVQHWYRCRWRPAIWVSLVFLLLTFLGSEVLNHFGPFRLVPRAANKPN